MDSKILKIIIVTSIFGTNLAFPDAEKVPISHADYPHEQVLHGWCQPRSQHLLADQKYSEPLLRHTDLDIYVAKQSGRKLNFTLPN